MKVRALLLDRDDTLNEDPGYINDPGLVRLLPGVASGLERLREAGFKFYVLTNQSGISRGMISSEQLERVHARLSGLLGDHGIRIEKFYVCPHRDEDGCSCRKPRPGLVDVFLRENQYATPDCFIIGDKLRDIQAGEQAEIRGILLESGGRPPSGADPKNLVFRAPDLETAAAFILSLEK